MRNFEVSSVADLVEAKNFMLQTQENVTIVAVSDIEYKIKLKGGKYDEYDLSYFDADIAKIVLEYQKQHDSFLDALQEHFSIFIPKEERILKFKIEAGCLEILTTLKQETIDKVIEKMNGWQITLSLLVIFGAWVGNEAFNHMVNRDIEIVKQIEQTRREEIRANENIATLDVLRHTISTLESIATNKDFQRPANDLKRNIAKTLNNEEEAILNPELLQNTNVKITSADKNRFISVSPRVEDIEEERIEEDYIEAQSYLKDNKPFKFKDLAIVADSANLTPEQRMTLTQKAYEGQRVRVRIKITKDGITQEIKTARIMDVLN